MAGNCPSETTKSLSCSSSGQSSCLHSFFGKRVTQSRRVCPLASLPTVMVRFRVKCHSNIAEPLSAVALASAIAFFSSISYYLQYLYQYSFLCKTASIPDERQTYHCARCGQARLVDPGSLLLWSDSNDLYYRLCHHGRRTDRLLPLVQGHLDFGLGNSSPRLRSLVSHCYWLPASG